MTTTIQKYGTKWYARVRWYFEKKRMEKTINLETGNKSVALKRFREVELFSKDVMNANAPVWSWKTCDKMDIYTQYDLQNAISDYLLYLETNGDKDSTLDRAKCCLKNVIKALGCDILISEIDVDKIEYFKYHFKDRLTKTGINIVLTRLKGLLNWCKDVKGIISKAPKIRFIKVPKKAPAYLTEENLNRIMALETLDSHYKQAFQMYLETGMRLREPFNGNIDGKWLVIHPNDTKTGVYREISLKAIHISIIKDMKERMDNSDALFKTETDKYSKVFKGVAKEIGREDLHFHNLRDTFAVMRYLETRDIYQVSKELGHTSVKVTEKYAAFNLRKLAQDFPILARNYSAVGGRMGGRKRSERRFIERAMA